MFKSKYYLPKGEALRVQNFESRLHLTYDKDSVIYENLIILPPPEKIISTGDFYQGVVCTDQYRVIDSCQCFTPLDLNKSLGIQSFYFSRPPKNIEISNETVIWGGKLTGHFGHFITDTMSRLWYAIKNRDLEYKLAFIADNRFDGFKPFHIEMFEQLGIETERILTVDRPTKFKEIIIPKPSWYTMRGFNKELFPIAYNAAVKDIKPKERKKIYISRSKFHKSDMFNESYFQNFFEEQGFITICPEQIPLKEQLAYIVGADEVATTIGTLSNLALFAKQNTKLICLYRAQKPSLQQYVVSYAKNLDYVYVDTSMNFFPINHVTDSYLIGPTVYWSDFVKNEYGIDLGFDVFEYLDKNNIKLGSYIKQFLTESSIEERSDNAHRIHKDYDAYIRSLFTTFEPSLEERYLHVLEHSCTLASYLFTNKIFILRLNGPNQNHTKIIKLNDDGQIKYIFGSSKNFALTWACRGANLFFYNDQHRPTFNWIAVRKNNKNMLVCNGYLKSDNSIMSKLIEINIGEYKKYLKYKLIVLPKRAAIKVIIKGLVDKKRYRKFKSTPKNFFHDSKSKFIRMLGILYL